METLQNLLTLAIEVVAIAGFGGIALHSIWSSHCKWMNEYCPPVKSLEEPAVEEVAVEEVAVEEVAVEEVAVEEPAVEEPAVEEPAVEEPAVEEPAVEEPAVTINLLLSKYEAMNVKRLRQECQVRCIDWKRGGDYGKQMRKNQMIKALTA